MSAATTRAIAPAGGPFLTIIECERAIWALLCGHPRSKLFNRITIGWLFRDAMPAVEAADVVIEAAMAALILRGAAEPAIDETEPGAYLTIRRPGTVPLASGVLDVEEALHDPRSGGSYFTFTAGQLVRWVR